jgi:adenylate kinase family enzyme
MKKLEAAVSLDYSRAHYIHLLGPTNVGKGYVCKLLKRHSFNGVLAFIGLGDLIRDRLKTDLEFRHRYASVIARGDLVSDLEVNPIVMKENIRVRNKAQVVITDGLFRNAKQVRRGRMMGMLGANSTILVLDALPSTCIRRAADRVKRKPDGPRLDANDIQRRLRIYEQHFTSVLAAFQETSAQIYRVPADRDIESGIFPDVVAHVNFALTMIPAMMSTEQSVPAYLVAEASSPPLKQSRQPTFNSMPGICAN